MQNKKLKDKPNKSTKITKVVETEERPALGLGDSIAQLTKITKIDKLVKFIAGEDCGCDERKEKLNKLFRYSKPLCLIEEEFNYLTEFQKSQSNTLSKEEADKIASIWNRVFQSRRFYRPCTCDPKAWQNMINELLMIYKTYESNS